MTLPIPSLSTWSVGDPITAAALNAQIRDGLTYLLNPPQAVLIQTSATTSMANNAWTTVTFNDNPSSIVSDTYGGFSFSANTRYTAQVAGWYLVSGVICYFVNATGQRAVRIAKNGTAVAGTVSYLPSAGGSTNTAVPTPTRLVQLAVGDYIELQGAQTSGGALATVAASDTTSMLSVLWAHA